MKTQQNCCRSKTGRSSVERGEKRSGVGHDWEEKRVAALQSSTSARRHRPFGCIIGQLDRRRTLFSFAFLHSPPFRAAFVDRARALCYCFGS